MFSLESEVLARHLSLFAEKSVLFFGYVRDDFAQNLKDAKNIAMFSSYFDYAHSRQVVEFGVENTKKADLAVYYWAKNKQECQYQLLEWLAQAQVGQELLIIGENRAGVRSVEKMLEPFGNIAKIDSARRCGLYHFELQNVPTFNAEKFWKSYELNDLMISALPAVFSSAELDGGDRKSVV